MARVIAMLLAGGQGSRLSILSSKRAKPAVPFGGNYKIIDFTLSNIMHANIGVVGILTQYRPHSLTEHISSGSPWGFSGRNRVARILPPYKGDDDSDWYCNTADAIWQNREFIKKHSPDIVLILSGDHIYKMDYAEMIQTHIERKADVTLAVQTVPWADTSRFGLVEIDDMFRVKSFQEKPKTNPISNLASLGIYVFNTDVLLERLEEDAANPGSEKDFGKNVLPAMLSRDRMYGHIFDNYWRDVGTIESYWQAHMEMLDPGRTGLDINKWDVRTNYNNNSLENLVASSIASTGKIHQSSISAGTVISGEINRSIIAQGVHIGKGARIIRSIIMPNCVIEDNAIIEDCIIDENSVIEAGSKIGLGNKATVNKQYPDLLNCGVTVLGEGCRIGAGVSIGKNALIAAGAKVINKKGIELGDGSTVLS